MALVMTASALVGLYIILITMHCNTQSNTFTKICWKCQQKLVSASFFLFTLSIFYFDLQKLFFTKVLTEIKNWKTFSLVHINVPQACLYLVFFIDGPSMYLCMAKNYLLSRIANFELHSQQHSIPSYNLEKVCIHICKLSL